jgi:ankyrin repeat protein
MLMAGFSISADVNVHDDNGETPLHLAAERDNAYLISHLLQYVGPSRIGQYHPNVHHSLLSWSTSLTRAAHAAQSRRRD